MLNQQLDYLQKLERFSAIKPGLTVIRQLLATLDNPHTQFASIHIAGTNGKGSTAAFLNSILNQTNLKIGLYTSPHLRQFNERVVVNNQPISNTALSTCIEQVRQAATRVNLSPTHFEFTTAVAFLYFARQSVDLAIIEVGLGGLLDATNVITPMLSIITNIDIDHQQWLGHTKLSIAKRKAGIIKPKIPLITAETNPSTISFLQRHCATHQSPFYQVQPAITTTITNRCLSHQSFRTTGVIDGQFSIPLLGQHQITNATTAILATHLLSQMSFFNTKLSSPQIKQGLSQTNWPGRSTIVSSHPFVLLDGAHNQAGFAALSNLIDSYHLPPPDTLIIGLKQDKNPQLLLQKIIPRFRRIIVTEPNYQPLPATRLARLISTSVPQLASRQIKVIPRPAQALAAGYQSLASHKMLLITGSLYLVGDILTALATKKAPPSSDKG